MRFNFPGKSGRLVLALIGFVEIMIIFAVWV